MPTRTTGNKLRKKVVISRRRFMVTALAAAAWYPFGVKKAFAYAKAERSLDLYNTHTGESLGITYYSDGRYDPDALARINYLLRCHYTNEVKEIDRDVLDLLSDVKDAFGRNRQLKIISGYRSPEYNAYLRKFSRGVAKDSLHLKGMAIDFAIDGIDSSRISGVARSFVAGGVGRYPEFVHIDVGRVRYW